MGHAEPFFGRFGNTPALAFDRALTYLPVFGLGMILAKHKDDVSRTVARLGGGTAGRWGWPSLTIISLLVLSSVGYVPSSLHGTVIMDIIYGVQLMAASGLLVAALHWNWFVGFLEKPTTQWLGSRSFSLYLVHEPIIVAAAIALRPTGWGWMVFMIPLFALCLFTANIFYGLVEYPAIRLSRQIGDRSRTHVVDLRAKHTRGIAKVAASGE